MQTRQFPRTIRFSCALTLASTVLATPACQTDPQGSDAFVADDAGFFNRGFGRGVAYYLPNRLIDLFDIVHVGGGFGPGAGFELHLTRAMRIGAGAGIDDGVGWFGRMGQPFQSGHYARAAFSVWDAQEAIDQDLRWRIPFWDIGVNLHIYLWEAYLGVSIDEFFDFLTGLIAYDLKDDDFGRDSTRATRDVLEGGVEEALPKEPGH